MARNGRGIVYPVVAKGYAGFGIYLLNIGSSPEQLAGCIQRDGINVLIIDEEFVSRIPSAETLPEIATLTVFLAYHERDGEYPSVEKLIQQHSNKKTPLPLFPQHGPIVLMSSGTTGTPKGVLREEPGSPTPIASVLETVPWRANIPVQITASMFHAWGWGCLNIALAARNTVYTRRVFNAEQVLEDIRTHDIEGMVSSPIFLKSFFDFDTNVSSLKFIASSGNSLSPWLVEKVFEHFGPILCNFYGSTEISAIAAADSTMLAHSPTAAGKVCLGAKVLILDEKGNPAPTGTAGRIFCHSSAVLDRYTDPSTPINTYGNLIQIGDRGYLDEHGTLFVLGREDDMIIVGGENVYPRSVETVLEPLPGVKELYATGVSDPETFQRIAVWVVREDSPQGAALTPATIQEWVREKLADHSVPRDVHFIDKLPRNATGKIAQNEIDRKKG